MGWDTPLLDPGLEHDRRQQCASRCRCPVPDLFRLRLRLHDPTTVITLVRGAHRPCMYGFLAWLRRRLS